MKQIFTSCAAVLLATSLQCIGCLCDAPISQPTAAAINYLTPAQIEAEAGLQIPVTLDAKRQPLDDLLGTLAKTAGVTLGPASAAVKIDSRVTLSVQGLKLGELLDGLARLYDFRWSKVGPVTYVYESTQRTEAESEALRLGDLRAVQSYYFKGNNAALAALSQQLQQGANAGALQTRPRVHISREFEH